MRKDKQKEPFRKFLGQYPEKPNKECTKEERETYKTMTHFVDKMLHAYTKGYEYFTYGFNMRQNIKSPAWFKVEQEYIKD